MNQQEREGLRKQAEMMRQFAAIKSDGSFAIDSTMARVIQRVSARFRTGLEYKVRAGEIGPQQVSMIVETLLAALQSGLVDVRDDLNGEAAKLGAQAEELEKQLKDDQARESEEKLAAEKRQQEEYARERAAAEEAEAQRMAAASASREEAEAALRAEQPILTVVKPVEETTQEQPKESAVDVQGGPQAPGQGDSSPQG